MNVYTVLNQITDYIDKHLEDKIDYKVLANMMGVNTYTLQQIFLLITGISLSEYIRKRRLSNAGFDLLNENVKVIDIAIKYHYNNATSFSRAFEKFHEVKPSKIKTKKEIKNFPKITFNETNIKVSDIKYKIIDLEKMVFYKKGIKCTSKTIGKMAPAFFEITKKAYGDIKYAMVTYEKNHQTCNGYYCLYERKIDGFEKVTIPKCKWLVFYVPSQNANDIQRMVHKFYQEFFPSSKYRLNEIPELEYYHDNITEFLVPIM